MNSNDKLLELGKNIGVLDEEIMKIKKGKQKYYYNQVRHEEQSSSGLNKIIVAGFLVVMTIYFLFIHTVSVYPYSIMNGQTFDRKYFRNSRSKTLIASLSLILLTILIFLIRLANGGANTVEGVTNYIQNETTVTSTTEVAPAYSVWSS